MLPTDADFNAATRTILYKLAIYLDGAGAAPLEITRDNYLIDFTLLEEATSGDTPFDNPSANELSITLYSPNGIFNPANTSSTYYGKMKRGVCVRPYVRTSSTQDWAQTGEFFVTDWISNLAGDVATITADDILYDVNGRQAIDFPVQSNMTVSNFLTAFFNYFDITPTISSSVSGSVVKAYIVHENKEFLRTLAAAFMLTCNVAHNGVITVRSLSTPQVTRAVLRDTDQVMSIDAKLSVNSDYDAAYLTYYMPTESLPKELLSVSAVTLSTGSTTVTYNLDQYPLLRLMYVALLSEMGLCRVTAATCTSKTIQITMSNSRETSTEAQLAITGTTINPLEYSLGAQGQNTLKEDNIYIQTPTHAQSYLTILQRFVASNIPIITAQIRGNPLLEIGDKIQIISTRDNINFTGILMRQNYHYNGGLTSDITLLNSALVEVTP